MFEAEQSFVENEIHAYCEANGLPVVDFQWKWIPFSGHWGISTAFFQLAAQEARQGRQINVNQRARELAQAVADHLGLPESFERVEAVNGYLNLYFSQSVYARRVDTVLLMGSFDAANHAANE